MREKENVREKEKFLLIVWHEHTKRKAKKKKIFMLLWGDIVKEVNIYVILLGCLKYFTFSYKNFLNIQ